MPFNRPVAKTLAASFKWNSIRLSGPAHGIETKTVHKTPPGGRGWWGSGSRGWGSRRSR